MNKAHVIFNKGYIKPLSEHSESILKDCKHGTIGYFVQDGIRDPKTHRRYFQMLRVAFDNQELYKSREDFRDIMQMKAGYFRTVPTDKGTVLYLPQSIKYEELDEGEFTEVCKRVQDEVIKFIGVNVKDFEKAIELLIKFNF